MPADENFRAKLSVDDRDYTSKLATAGVSAMRLGGMAVAGAAVAATAYIALTRRLSLLGAEVVQGGYKIGASTRDMQSLKTMATLTGAPLDGLGSSYRKLNELFMTNAKYGGTLKTTIQGLGLNFEELGKMTPVERFQALLLALASIKDPLERLEKTREIFQNESEGVYPVIERKPKDLGEIVARAKNEGDQLPPAAAAKGEKAAQGWGMFAQRAIAGAARAETVQDLGEFLGKDTVAPGVSVVAKGLMRGPLGPILTIKDMVKELVYEIKSIGGK